MENLKTGLLFILRNTLVLLILIIIVLPLLKYLKYTFRKDIGICNSIMEEFFTDTILQKHATKLLLNYKLRSLGYFAARLDFHLVEWLAKERNGAARIDNYIAALRSLYTDFSIARPLSPVQKHSSLSSSGLFTIDKPKWVDGGSAVGDSGYMSCQDIPQVSSQYPQDGFLTGIGE